VAPSVRPSARAACTPHRARTRWAVVAVNSGQSAPEEEIIAYCKERFAAYKYPRGVRFLDQMPKGPTGKIAKKELKAAPVESRA